MGMNTNMKMNLCNLLAPPTGEMNVENGPNALLNGVKGAKKGDFDAIVQQLRADNDTPKNTNSPGEDKLSLENVLDSEISSKLAQLLSGKEVKAQNIGQANSDITLSEIAAMIQANPEKLANLEDFSLTNGQLSPEHLERIAEIKDFLASLQTSSEGISGNTPAVSSGETMAQAIDTATQVPADIAIAAATENTVAGENAELIQQANSELPQITATNETSQTVVANVPQQMQAVQPQGMEVTETTKTPFSDLNKVTVQPQEADSQQQNLTNQQTSPAKTDALTAAVQESFNEGETIDKQSTLPQVAPSPEQILAKEAENRQNPLTAKGFKAEMEATESISENQPGSGGPEAVETGPQTPAFAKPTIGSVSNADIARQVQETISTSYRPSTQQVVIRLDPPELGKVTMRFIEKPDGITGILQVDQAQTRQEIERALPEIIQNLQNSSVQIKKVDVVATHHQNDDPNRSESGFAGQDSEFQQQNAPQGPGNQGSFHESTGGFENPGQPNQPDMLVSEKSINMLI